MLLARRSAVFGAAAAVLLLLVALTTTACADLYIQGMRGSNNRLNEANNNRNNGNRLFDSQNNNRGGYNVGVDGRTYYYVGSKVALTWTNQHACSDPKLGCELVIQYMCSDILRDGDNTDTPPEGTDALTATTGLHESPGFYSDCKTRQRNRGLFVADQLLQGDTAIYTRQNPAGTRRGLECPEERDYYPYWHPAPWKDIAILTSNTSRCEYYRAESQNVKGKGFCAGFTAANNPATCAAGAGTWAEAQPFGIAPPECLLAPWSRDNHLGNGYEPWENMYNWTVPNDVAGKCVLRMRYNISTFDYPWELNSTFNGNKSPVRDNPTVDFGIRQGLRLALNTDQYGRTFQDRTHIFEIRARPSNIPATATIWNINVRGKRGNIVQVYPAVEYDFVPNVLTIRAGDYVHWQWSGSDTNALGNDGQGTAGTDRSNIVQIDDLNDNFPTPAGNVTLFSSMADIERFARAGAQSSPLLNDAPAYFDGGAMQMTRVGTYHYMCTRNNNFSNRSQKATLIIEPAARDRPSDSAASTAPQLVVLRDATRSGADSSAHVMPVAEPAAVAA